MLRSALQVLWPAFLAACALEFLVFAQVDPRELHGFGGTTIELSRQAIYTLAFFAFWAIVGVACAVCRQLDRVQR
jgi:hypothetical protein